MFIFIGVSRTLQKIGKTTMGEKDGVFYPTFS
jgi:hypothetical protein